MRSSLFLVATTAILAGCSPKESTTTATATGGTLIVAPAADAIDIFPPFVTDFTGRLVQDQVFDRLAEINYDLVTTGDKGFSPRLATKWSWAPDSLSIAFSLDPRARWHDGKPVTASDVRYSFGAFTNPKIGSPVTPLLGNIDSVSIRDSLTPVFWFKKRTPEQFYDVAYQILVLPEHVYGAIPPEQLHTSEITRHPIGTGQFRFVKWDAGTRIELIADTANFRGRPKLDRVILAPAEAPTAATQLLNGEADFMDAFPIDRVAELDSNIKARPLILPTVGYIFLAMSRFTPKSKTALHPIFSDTRVRRAVAMSLDRVSMLQNVFGTTGRISHGPFPMSVAYADSTLHLPAFDTTAAKAMLDSAGWRAGPDGIRGKGGRPLRFSVLAPTSSLFRRRYAVLIQEQLRKIGAQVDVDLTDGKTAMERVQAGNFDAVLWGFNPDPSPSATKQNWGTAGIGASGQNVLRYSNPKVDALLDSSTSAFDAAKMKSYSARAFQTIIDDVPAVFLYDQTFTYAVNRRITVAPMRVDEWWANLADWSIPVDKRIDRDRIGLRSATP